MEGSGRGLILTYYPGICPEGLRKTMETLSQDNRSPSRDLNHGSPEYNAGSVNHSITTFGVRLEEDTT
jgi:hypothetical protein